MLPREYGICTPFGSIIGERPWAWRFLSEGRASGGGVRNDFSRSGGINSVVICLSCFGSTGIPIISLPRRRRSGAKMMKMSRKMCRKMEVKNSARRRQFASS